jgi:hypothetical protein
MPHDAMVSYLTKQHAMVPYATKKHAMVATGVAVGAAGVAASDYQVPKFVWDCCEIVGAILASWVMDSDSKSRDVTMVFDNMLYSIMLMILVLFLKWRFITDIKTNLKLCLIFAVFYFLVFHLQQKLSDFQPSHFEKILEPIYKDWFLEQVEHQILVSKSSAGCVKHLNHTTCGSITTAPAMPTIRYQPVVEGCSIAELERLVFEIRFNTNTMLAWTMECWIEAELLGEHYCENLKRVYSNEKRVSPSDLQHYCPHQLPDHALYVFWCFFLVLSLDVLSNNLFETPRVYESHSPLDGDDPPFDPLTPSH